MYRTIFMSRLQYQFLGQNLKARIGPRRENGREKGTGQQWLDGQCASPGTPSGNGPPIDRSTLDAEESAVAGPHAGSLSTWAMLIKRVYEVGVRVPRASGRRGVRTASWCSTRTSCNSNCKRHRRPCAGGAMIGHYKRHDPDRRFFPPPLGRLRRPSGDGKKRNSFEGRHL